MSSAASSESVAGDSGVFEASTVSPVKVADNDNKLSSLMAAMSFEAAQVQVKIRYDRDDSLLHVGIERARNLRALAIRPNSKIYLKVSLVPSVSPTNWSFSTKTVNATVETPVFGETFPVAVPKAKLSTKTLQVTVWTIPDSSAGDREDCVGSAQVSLADFDWESVSVRWYNVLSLHFMLQPQKSSAASTSSVILSSSSNVSSRQGTLKEESSDDSTIISSQASTLTRNIDPTLSLEAAAEDVMSDVVIPSEPCKAFQLEQFLARAAKYTEKETNTECVFVQPTRGAAAYPASPAGTGSQQQVVVKRSKTFSPSVAESRGYLACRLNRSDSDGSMPLYKKLPFQHKMLERRSLRQPKASMAPRLPSMVSKPAMSMSSSSGQTSTPAGASVTKLQLKRNKRLARTREHVLETPLDLELDLAAQKTKLNTLTQDIVRLKEIKRKLEEAKAQGKESAGWLQDHEYLQDLLAKVSECF